MLESLNRIRQPKPIPLPQKLLYSLLLLLAGVLLGTVSKLLDTTPANLLPPLLESLDLRNFFSRIGVWLFITVVISVYATTPFRAAVNVFLFFAGMVGSYYLYTVFVAGFYPKAYMMLWIALTLVSPFLAFLCWYAKGSAMLSVCLAAVIVLFLTRQAFAFGFWYLNIKNCPEFILWIATGFVLYQSPKQLAKVVGLGILLFFLSTPSHLLGGLL